MTGAVTADLCVIGAGSGGLSVAAGAAQMGASVVLVEAAKMGGDCLNTGCVPSKALLAAGHAADAVRRARRFGVRADDPAIDAAGVYGHVAATIRAIEPHDSVERFEGLGVRVIQERARFVGPAEVEAGPMRIRARRVVVATGSHPFVPPIPGLETVPYLTNETVFARESLPAHLVVVGGGPIGAEMAQAHARLGCKVTVLEMARLLPKDDPGLVAVVRARLIADGIDVREGAKVRGVERTGAGVAVVVSGDGGEDRIDASHILIAAGRRPTVDGLNLDAAAIAYSSAGIAVDARMRTTNKKVFAIGDVTAGGAQFTHMAGYQAGIVIRNALFRLPAKVRAGIVPWVTYTAPELAQVGLTEAQARAANGDGVRILTATFADNDRARAEGETEGLIKAVADRRGRILGCGIAGAHAGELIQPWILAMENGLKIGAMASTLAPYPTLSEISKRAAGAFYTPALFGPRTRWLVRLLARLG